MKVYQETWFKKLNDAMSTFDLEVIKDVCNEICDDDTGGTDQLAQALAELVLILSVPDEHGKEELLT